MKKKILVVVLCVTMMAIGGLATWAYLTDEDAATNTFTVGNVDIFLDEAKVTPDGEEVVGADRVKGNEYHLIPGHTYVKDPTVTVVKDSEESYVRMLVTVKNIDKLKAAIPNSGNTTVYYGKENGKDVFLLQMLCGGWDPEIWPYVAGSYKETTDENNVTSGTYEFRYFTTVAKDKDSNTVLEALFETITVPGTVDNTHLAYLDDVEINVVAQAIQADGFNTAEKAWKEFK